MCKLQLLNGLNSLDSGILVFWDPGSWFWILDSGVLDSEFWNSGILEFWNSGILDNGFRILDSSKLPE